MLDLPATPFVSFAAAAILVGLIRAYALRHNLLDIPNERSSHTRPTPRGGGLAIVAVLLAVTAYATYTGALPQRTGLTLLAGSSAVALVGWVDDRHTLRNRIRVPAWLLIAIGTTISLRGLPALNLGFGSLAWGPVGAVLAVIAIVWMINLYNFMDGIDGLAATETAVATAFGGALLYAAGDVGLAIVAWSVGAAAAGFLLWNWAPAKIFMGDVGSGTLGYAFAVLALASERAGTVPLLVWAILLMVFLVDATFTVLRRTLRGEPWHEPHRTHAYQLLIQRGLTHRTVTAAAAALSAALGGLAVLAWRQPALLLPAAAAALVLVAVPWLYIVRATPPNPPTPADSPRSARAR